MPYAPVSAPDIPAAVEKHPRFRAWQHPDWGAQKVQDMMIPPGAPALWHLHSEVLGGFYQSDVIVLARSQQEAVDACCLAFGEYIDQQIIEYYCVTVDDTYLDPDDDQYAQRRERVTARFRAEAETRITCIENGRLLRHKS